MKKKLSIKRENTQYNNVGRNTDAGATEQFPFNPPQMDQPDVRNQKYPYELNFFKERLFEILAKTIELHGQFKQGLDNPSVSRSQKAALSEAISDLDKINMRLTGIPDLLKVFSVDQ